MCAVYFSLPYYHPTFHLSAPCALQSANTRLYLSKGQAHDELAPLSFGSSDGEQSVHRFIPRFHYRWRHFYNPPAHPRRGQNTSFCVCDPKATHTIAFIALPNALHGGTNGVNQILVGDADRGLLLTLRLGELVAPLLTTLTHTNRKNLVFCVKLAQDKSRIVQVIKYLFVKVTPFWLMKMSGYALVFASRISKFSALKSNFIMDFPFGIRDFSALSAVRGVPKLSSAGLK